MANIQHPIFQSAKSKIKRANHHFNELARMTHNFPESPYYRITVEGNPQITGETLTFEVKDELLEKVALIVGDMIHNLRTALDHLFYELVMLSGGTATQWTRFPFGKTREEAISAIDGVIQGVSLDVVTSIVEHVRPYRGGNDALYTLHTLDIVDKHRLLVPVLVASWVTFLIKNREEKPVQIVCSAAQDDKTGVVHLPVGTEFKDYRNPSVLIFFENVEGLERQSVIPALHQLRQMVLAVVEEIERAFLLRRT